MPKFRIHGTVTASTYLGEIQAKDEAEAIKKAERRAHVSVCHQCAKDISDPEVTELTAEEVT